VSSNYLNRRLSLRHDLYFVGRATTGSLILLFRQFPARKPLKNFVGNEEKAQASNRKGTQGMINLFSGWRWTLQEGLVHRKSFQGSRHARASRL
jgi:hypothetical protein